MFSTTPGESKTAPETKPEENLKQSFSSICTQPDGNFLLTSNGKSTVISYNPLTRETKTIQLQNKPIDIFSTNKEMYYVFDRTPLVFKPELSTELTAKFPFSFIGLTKLPTATMVEHPPTLTFSNRSLFRPYFSKMPELNARALGLEHEFISFSAGALSGDKLIFPRCLGTNGLDQFDTKEFKFYESTLKINQPTTSGQTDVTKLIALSDGRFVSLLNRLFPYEWSAELFDITTDASHQEHYHPIYHMKLKTKWDIFFETSENKLIAVRNDKEGSKNICRIEIYQIMPRHLSSLNRYDIENLHLKELKPVKGNLLFGHGIYNNDKESVSAHVAISLNMPVSEIKITPRPDSLKINGMAVSPKTNRIGMVTSAGLELIPFSDLVIEKALEAKESKSSLSAPAKATITTSGVTKESKSDIHVSARALSTQGLMPALAPPPAKRPEPIHWLWKKFGL